MEISLSNERSKVFIYTQGDEAAEFTIKMMTKRQLDHIQKEFPLRDGDNQIVRDELKQPVIDWNSAGEYMFGNLIVSWQGLTENGKPIPVTPHTKAALAKAMPVTFFAWVFKCSRDSDAFFRSEKEVAENLPPVPDGPTA